MSFTLSKAINPSKVFLTKMSEVTGRFDPFFYRPELVALEKKVRRVATHRLRDYILWMAGGATPATTESDTHYTESPDGVPFIRVQNLSTTGHLNLEDYKRITRATHNGLLARSRLSGGELLVKITGVGRMAVASVVPDNFEGNINQHIVAIRTKNKQTSEALAAYLNLDIAERLATRRSTGGTRPALDYPALLSIPIIFNTQATTLVATAVAEYKNKLSAAKDTLKQVDDVLLTELGITLKPESPNTIKSRIFRGAFVEVTGSRLDPFFHKPQFAALEHELLADKRYSLIRSLGYLVRGVVYTSEDERDEGKIIIRANNIDLETGELDLKELVRVRESIEFNNTQKLAKNDILICAASGSKIHAGKVSFISDSVDAYFGGFMMVLRVTTSTVIPEYLGYYMQSKLFRRCIFRHLGGTNINNLSVPMVLGLGVIIPSKPVQEQICDRIRRLRKQSKVLRNKAEEDFKSAIHKIEARILSEGGGA